MIKKLIRRYWLVALLFAVFVATGGLFYHQPGAPKEVVAEPPAQVIIAQANVIDQGVQLEWLKAQAGKHPIAGYVLERSRGDGGFERIARVEPVFVEFLDSDGRAGDAYRITAEDSEGGRSSASEHAVATVSDPGSVVAISPRLPRVLGATTALERADTPAQKAEALQKLIDQSFAGFAAALDSKDNGAARDLLQMLQGYQRQALSLWPQLTPAQKAPLAQACTDRLGVFEANMHILPEDDQFDGMLVVAGCDALQEGIE